MTAGAVASPWWPEALVLLLLVLGSGVIGAAVLRRLGLDDTAAWIGGRVAGPVLVVLPAWWWGSLGLAGWRVAAVATLMAGLAVALWCVGRGAWPALDWRRCLRAEAMLWIAFLLVLVLRLDRPEIRGQEKPMDLGIFATLVRAESFPPPDMWLAGETLPYYYWGALIWALPLGLSGVPLELGYNLTVALVGSLVLCLAWCLAARLGGGRLAGPLGAFFAVLAGTPDGLRQLLQGGGHGPGLTGIDIWASSRQVAGTITEFPLFTVWLGDLHPHLLSMPLALAAMLLALATGRQGGRWDRVLVLAVLVGATWAANPWAMPPTLVAVVMLLLIGDGCVCGPAGAGRARWLAALCVAVGSGVLTLPFHLGFHPPFDGLGLVRAWTPPLQLLLYGGCLLVPALAAALVLLRDAVGSVHPRRAASLAWFLGIAGVYLLAAVVAGRLLWLAVAVILASLWLVLGRRTGPSLAAADGWSRWIIAAVLLGPALICLVLSLPLEQLAVAPRSVTFLLLLPLMVLGAAALGPGAGRDRPAMMLAALGVFLLIVPEVIHVRDAYGEGLHRMNTVFKAWIQAWLLLAVTLPALLWRAFDRARGGATAVRRGLLARRRLAGIVVLVVLVLASTPHLAGLVARSAGAGWRGLDGLAWMAPADRALIRTLRATGSGTSLVEWVGDAYSDAGRISSASGVPAFLGWANHELVWRGPSAQHELDRRRGLTRQLASCQSPEEIRRLMQATTCDLLVIGSLERVSYPVAVIDAMRQAGEVVLDMDGGVIIRFGPDGPAGDEQRATAGP